MPTRAPRCARLLAAICRRTYHVISATGTYRSERVKMKQQDFLREAMTVMNVTPEAFAARLGTSPGTLQKWLLPESADDFRTLAEPTWMLVREILAHEKQQKK